MIKNYLVKGCEVNTIIVDDLDDKINEKYLSNSSETSVVDVDNKLDQKSKSNSPKISVLNDKKDMVSNLNNKNNNDNIKIFFEDDTGDKVMPINVNETALQMDENKIKDENPLPLNINKANNLLNNSIKKNEDLKELKTIFFDTQKNNKSEYENDPNIKVFKYETQVKSKNPKIKIFLVTTSHQMKVKILIDPENTMTQLIKFYFDKINRPDLFGDPSIRFLANANFIPHDSKDFIKKYIQLNCDFINIIINDVDDKID